MYMSIWCLIYLIMLVRLVGLVEDLVVTPNLGTICDVAGLLGVL